MKRRSFDFARLTRSTAALVAISHYCAAFFHSAGIYPLYNATCLWFRALRWTVQVPFMS
jgi:hypothetical protein